MSIVQEQKTVEVYKIQSGPAPAAAESNRSSGLSKLLGELAIEGWIRVAKPEKGDYIKIRVVRYGKNHNKGFTVYEEKDNPGFYIVKRVS